MSDREEGREWVERVWYRTSKDGRKRPLSEVVSWYAAWDRHGEARWRAAEERWRELQVAATLPSPRTGGG